MAAQEFQLADVVPEEPAVPADQPPADHGGEETHTSTEHEGHGAKPGLPQLDATTFAGQIFWLVISLVILYIVLSRAALPKIQSVLADRAGRIKGDLDAAAEAKRASEAAIAGYDKALADARAKAVKASDEIRNHVQAEVNAKSDAASKQLAADTAKAETRIADMRQKAMANVADVARDTAAEIVTKLTGTAASADELTAAVRNALKPA